MKAYKQPVSTEELLAGVTLSRMHRIFVDIIRRQNNRIDPIRSTFGTLQKEEVDMDQMREKVAEYIEQHEVCNFRNLLLGQSNENAGYHSISHHSGDDEGRRYYDRSGGKFR